MYYKLLRYLQNVDKPSTLPDVENDEHRRIAHVPKNVRVINTGILYSNIDS